MSLPISQPYGGAPYGGGMFGGGFGPLLVGAPTFTGTFGVVDVPGSSTARISGPGSLQPGGPGPFLFPPPPALLPKTQALPFIAHLYSNSLTFKKSLGPLLARPKLKWTLNAGHSPVQLDLPFNDTTAIGPSQGDIVRLTEQGGDGKVVYTGILADIQLNVDVQPPYVSLQLDPLVTELGEAPYDHNYSRPTDIAQMVRDAVNQASHLTYTPQSIPDTGIFAVFNFHVTNALEVLNTCKHIGGPNFFFYVDEYGIVWFHSVSFVGTPVYTLRDGFTVRKKSSPISSLKNYVLVAGGLPDQKADGNALFSIYSDPASRLKYGTRFFTPILYYPAAVHQGTLDAIAFNVGTIMNRIRVKVELTLPAFGNRITLGRFGGPSIRYWEPSVNPMAEIAVGGNFSPNYVVLDVEMDGPTQKVICGDLPVTSDDFKYMVDGTIARLTHNLLLYPPLSTQHYTIFGASGLVGSQ
jgi:hypothetical protein